MPIRKIVSGGQTGVDRAALDVALELGLGAGGWCPLGRRAEDGVIPRRYPLRETEDVAYDARTRLNVRDSGATLILCHGPPGGGTALTIEMARELGRPHLVVDLAGGADPAAVRAWLGGLETQVLNVAGPRQGTSPGIHAKAVGFLKETLADREGAGDI